MNILLYKTRTKRHHCPILFPSDFPRSYGPIPHINTLGWAKPISNFFDHLLCHLTKFSHLPNISTSHPLKRQKTPDLYRPLPPSASQIWQNQRSALNTIFQYRTEETPLTEPSLSPFRTISNSAAEEVHSQITLKGLSLCLSGILGLPQIAQKLSRRVFWGKFLAVLLGKGRVFESMEAYKKWVRENKDYVHSLESLANVSSLNFSKFCYFICWWLSIYMIFCAFFLGLLHFFMLFM